MSVATTESHATITEGGKRRSGGFLGFGRKKDKPKIEEEDVKAQRQSFTVSGRPSGGPPPDLSRPMSQPPAALVHQNGRVVQQQQQQQQQQRSDFGPAPPPQHARAQSLGANQVLAGPPAAPRAVGPEPPRNTPPESPASFASSSNIDSKDPSFRQSFGPVVELISYQPQKTYVSSPPELEMIFARTSAGQQPRQGAPGSPTNDWDAVWLQLAGTSLSMWSMKETRAAAAAGTKVPPTYFNITESTLELLSPLPPPPHRPGSHTHKHVFSLNTAGSNRLLFSCPTDKDLVHWTTGLRLAAWERSRLEEIYTGHLIQAGRREPPPPLVAGHLEGWVRVRVMGGIEWHRLWLVLSDPAATSSETTGTQGKRRSSFFGLGHEKNEPIKEPNTGVTMASFYNEPRTSKNRTSSFPVITVTNVTQTYAMFPERLEVISQSNLMKVVGRVSGELVTIEGGLRESGWAMIMPEAPGGDNSTAANKASPLGTMMRWVTAFHDAFKLYGRPQRYSWNENDSRSLFFGYPRGEFRADLFLSMDEAMRANQRLNTPAIRAQFISILQRRTSLRSGVEQVGGAPLEDEDPKIAQERAYMRQAQQESAATHQAQQQQQQQQQDGPGQSFTLPPLQFSDENDQDSGPGATAAVAGAAAAGALAAAGAAAMFHDDPRALTPITESDASRHNSARRPTEGTGAEVGTALGSPTPVSRTIPANSMAPHAYQPDVPPGQQGWAQNQSRAPVQKGDVVTGGAAIGTAAANPTAPPVRPVSMATFGNRTSSDEIPSTAATTPAVTSPSREASTRQGTLRSEDSQPTAWSQSSGVTPRGTSPNAVNASYNSSFVNAAPMSPPANSVPNGMTPPVQRDSPAPPPIAKSPGMMLNAAVSGKPEAVKPTPLQFAQQPPQNAQSFGPGPQANQPQFVNQPSSPPVAAHPPPAAATSQSSHSHSKSSHATIPAVAAGAAAAGAAALGAQTFASQSPPRHSPLSDGTLHQPKPSRSQRMSMTEVPGLREEPAAMYLMNMVEEPALPAGLQGNKVTAAQGPSAAAVVAPAVANAPPHNMSPVRQAPAPAPAPASPPKPMPASPRRAVPPPAAALAEPVTVSTRAAAPHMSPPPNFSNPPAPANGPMANSLLASPPPPPPKASPPANTSANFSSTAVYVAGAGAGAVALGAAAAHYSQSPPAREPSPPLSPFSVGSDKPSRPAIVTALDPQQYHSRTSVQRKPSGARAQQQPLSAVRSSSGGSGEIVNAIQGRVDGGQVGRNATSPGTTDDHPIDNRVLPSPPAIAINSSTSPTTRAPNNVNASSKMHDFAPDTAAFLAYADESPVLHAQGRPQLPSPPQPAQEARSSFAPSKQATERRAKAEAAAAEHQRAMNLPGAGRQKAAQKPDNWDGSDTDESEDDEDTAVPAQERRGSRALPSLPQPPTIQQPAYQPQQPQQFKQQPQLNQQQYNQQQFHQQQQFYGGPGGPANGDRFEPPNMNNLSINDPHYDRPRSRSPPAPHRHLPPQPQQLPQELEMPRQQQQRAAPLPQPPAAKTNVWNANFEVEHGMDRKGTFVELEEPQVALTKAFTPGGLIQAGMQDKRDRSAKRQEEVARETGSALVNVPEPPPPPQTGLVGAVAAHERDRKNAGGIGATLTDRDRERRLAEDRQRKIDELQRQQMDHMQHQYTGGGMFQGQFPGYGYGMPPMGYNPYGMPMNPAAQQQAMMAAQMAYQQTMMAMSQAGSQAGDAPDGRMSPQSQMRMSPPPFQMGQMGQMPGMGFPGYGMPPTQSMYGGFAGYGMPGMGSPSAWGGSPAQYPQGLAPGNGGHSPVGGSYPSSERGEERQAS
ncbi:hypothetical protein CspHIS471_0510600 [Cutaneotrichosporon sp. HIS471]|nr:hypothetical protein CspHIS471_0510600 [Cutaneotrichosporon sp. HIS471]